jgi:8-oxo-dGTP pyrophosphatase MutT (NUDIX family)
MTESKPSVAPVPAATILLVRDAPAGMEVFMVKRHHQIDFVAGALVFPGGKAQASDFDAGLAEFADGVADWSDEMRALGAAIGTRVGARRRAGGVGGRGAPRHARGLSP